MKKFIIALLLVFCFTSFSFAEENVQEIDKTKELLVKIYESSVGIFSVGSTGVGFCSGVVLKNTNKYAYILTAKHCVGPYEETYVNNSKVEKILVSTDDDLALLITAEPIEDKKETVLASRNAKWLEYVYHIGFPRAELYMQIGYTWIRAIDHQYFKMSVISGCSGGGIFNENGELVSILWGSLGENITVGEPISDVKRFLKEANIQF